VPMRFNPIRNEFAAVVEGIDLCAPLCSQILACAPFDPGATARKKRIIADWEASN
jgi:hypothetical protein